MTRGCDEKRRNRRSGSGASHPVCPGDPPHGGESEHSRAPYTDRLETARFGWYPPVSCANFAARAHWVEILRSPSNGHAIAMTTIPDRLEVAAPARIEPMP